MVELDVAVVWVALVVVTGVVLATWLVGRSRVKQAQLGLEQRYKDLEHRLAGEQAEVREELARLRRSVEAVEALLRDVG